MADTTYIYGLYCPVKRCFFYVGKSIQPVGRYDSHMGHAKAAAMHTAFPHLYESAVDSFYSDPRVCWIAWLVQQEQAPELVILQQLERDEDDGKFEEREWIARLAAEGHPLTNVRGLTKNCGQAELNQAIQRGRELFGHLQD